MAGVHRNNVRVAVIVAALIAAAMACRFISRMPSCSADFLLGCVRSAIYIGLFTAWGISIRRRITQLQVRRFLTAIAALMIFWLAMRTLKYQFVTDPNAARYLWYLYYVGMLLIPLLSLLVAMSLGKPENYRLPRWATLLFVPTAALLLLVLTNDLHQLVFRFPEGAAVFTDKEYDYAVLYWPVIGWEIGCALSAIAVIR